MDAGYNLTPALKASVGYYYQNGDAGEADGSGVLGRLAYSINNGLTLGTNLSYDNAFKSRFSADIKWRFNTNGGPGKETPKSNAAVEALTSTPSNRDVRVHDDGAANAGKNIRLDCDELRGQLSGCPSQIRNLITTKLTEKLITKIDEILQ